MGVVSNLLSKVGVVVQKKVLEIEYCIECPHCNGYFHCAKLRRVVDEIPEDCPLPNLKNRDLDSVRIDFLEQQACASHTGISFDYAASMDGEFGGYRFMRWHQLHDRKKNIRDAIDAAIRDSVLAAEQKKKKVRK